MSWGRLGQCWGVSACLVEQWLQGAEATAYRKNSRSLPVLKLTCNWQTHTQHVRVSSTLASWSATLQLAAETVVTGNQRRIVFYRAVGHATFDNPLSQGV